MLLTLNMKMSSWWQIKVWANTSPGTLKAPCLTSWAQCRTQWQLPALITQRSRGTIEAVALSDPKLQLLVSILHFSLLPICLMSSVIMTHKELWGTITYCGKKSLPFLDANQKTPTLVCLLNVPVLRLTPSLVRSFSSKEPNVLRSRMTSKSLHWSGSVMFKDCWLLCFLLFSCHTQIL